MSHPCSEEYLLERLLNDKVKERERYHRKKLEEKRRKLIEHWALLRVRGLSQMNREATGRAAKDREYMREKSKKQRLALRVLKQLGVEI